MSKTSLTSGQQQETCPVMTAAMEKLPKLAYKVGDETTCCSVSAEALAREHSKPIHFVVAEKTFEDKTEAYTALVSHTEAFVNEFVTPCKHQAIQETGGVAIRDIFSPIKPLEKVKVIRRVPAIPNFATSSRPARRLP